MSEPVIDAMVNPARNDFETLVDETLLAVHAASVPDHVDPATVKVISAQLANVQTLAESQRLVRVGNVARHLQRMLNAVEAEGLSEQYAPTLRRGLDVLSLLAQDAERQRAGHPPAALDDAVDCFVDQVERCVRGERGARVMKFPLSRIRTRDAAAMPWPKPAGPQ